MMKKLQQLFCVMLLLSFAVQSSLAKDYINLVFDNADNNTDQIVLLSNQEMVETAGSKIPPLIALGFLARGGYFIVQRYISRRIAVNALRNMSMGRSDMLKGLKFNSSCNILCSNAAMARSIARQAYGKKNILRHGPSGHKNSHVDYSHFQALNKLDDKYVGHIFYGNRMPRIPE